MQLSGQILRESQRTLTLETPRSSLKDLRDSAVVDPFRTFVSKKMNELHRKELRLKTALEEKRVSIKQKCQD